MGTPDVNVCAEGGVETWVELKQTSGWVVGLRPAQVAWLDRRWRAGGRCLVLVRQTAGRVGTPRGVRSVGEAPRDVLWAFSGGAAVALAKGGLRGEGVLPLLTSGGGPRLWDWVGVAALLTGPLP